MSDSSNHRSPQVPAVVQAIRVMRCLGRSAVPMSVSAVARATAISPSTCFNLLRTLAAEGLVTFDPAAKTYSLGLGLLELASPLHGRGRTELIRPLLERLALDYDALVALWEVTENERIVLVDRVHGYGAVRIEMRIGQRVPAFAGAVGRCVAAIVGLSPGELRRRFEMLRWGVPIAFEDYLADVERAREDGFALDLGHWFKGINVVATAIADDGGRPRLGIAGLTIAGRLSEAELRRFGGEMRESARLIGRALFGIEDLGWCRGASAEGGAEEPGGARRAAAASGP